jgi:hypothetical protein
VLSRARKLKEVSIPALRIIFAFLRKIIIFAIIEADDKLIESSQCS